MNSKLNNSNLNIDDLKLVFSEVFQLSLDKFNKHINFYSTFKLFEAIRYFDPQYIYSQQSRRNIILRKSIPEPANPNDTTWMGIYSNLDWSFEDDLDLNLFWREALKALPNLSKIALDYIALYFYKYSSIKFI